MNPFKRLLNLLRRPKHQKEWAARYLKMTECGKSKDGLFISTKRIEQRQFYDSVWDVVAIKASERIKCRITRYDDEHAEKLESAVRIALTKKFDEESICALDLRQYIYYD